MVNSQTILVEASEHYQKKSYRNKCQLIGPNGSSFFSVPLQKGKHNKTSIREVRISYTDMWSSQFLKLCQSNYRKSPYYDFIIDDLTSILNEKYTYLFDLNMALLSWMHQFLQLDNDIKLTNVYQTESDPQIEDLREYFKPNKSLDIAASPYPQVFLEKHGFLANMSILDLLFCCGRESVNYL